MGRREKSRKTSPCKRGTLFPSITKFYQISAAGIDKIEGPGEFTMSKFHGIKIEATGQNIITLGDGNQINAQFSELGKSLVELREALTKSDTPEDQKLSLVADIDTIQSQLAKPEPNRSIVAAAWESVRLLPLSMVVPLSSTKLRPFYLVFYRRHSWECVRWRSVSCRANLRLASSLLK
jgi:hypothetical protein